MTITSPAGVTTAPAAGPRPATQNLSTDGDTQ